MTVPAARLPRHKKSTRKGKKQMLDELNEALKASQPLLYGENT
jgi:hypothetical protein